MGSSHTYVANRKRTLIEIREYLTDSGFRTVDAHNGHQALAKAQELLPNAVLTDLALPGMDGFEM